MTLTKTEKEKNSRRKEIDENNQPSFEEVQKQSEKEKKRIPWEILLMIAAILVGIYHFIGA
ncbi:MAG: vacuolar-type H+-ATPase subunit E/Vma4 [Candidatus Azotimanducaceae bacterium]|jgi:vacuolar-type H+-ATPase subunit E/Vma4